MAVIIKEEHKREDKLLSDLLSLHEARLSLRADLFDLYCQDKDPQKLPWVNHQWLKDKLRKYNQRNKPYG